MIKALAPGMPRGYSWVWLSIALVVGLSLGLEAQTSPTKPEKPAAKSDPSKKDPGDAAAADQGDDKGEDEPAPVEIFKDPRAEKALPNTFRPLPGGNISPAVGKAVKDMANGVSNVDRDTLQKFITGMAADLTNRANIQALIDPPAGKPQSRASRAIREASAALVEPMDLARKAGNTGFLPAYSQELLKTLPPLLKNHLLARMEAIIVLGQTGSPDALNVFAQQLNDKDQTVWVKLWAARGITNIVQTPGGNQVDSILGPKASVAARALANFLNREKDAPWPAQLRSLEALGALRLAADPAAQSKLEMADAALRLLADPEARPEVRAEAAWALGMMRINSAAGRINYPLIAYHIGEVAAQVGERVAETFDTNEPLTDYWTSLLVYQLYPALYGQSGMSESGLLNMPGASANRAALTQAADQVKALARNSVDLIKAPRGQKPQVAKELLERVGSLKTYLVKNPPADRRLVPGGREFPLRAEVAEAPAEQARVAGTAGAR